MVPAPFGVIVSIQIDGAYEGALVLSPYSVAETAERFPVGCYHIQMSYDIDISYVDQGDSTRVF